MNNTENPLQKALWLGTGLLAEAPDFNDRVFSELEATISHYSWNLRPDMDRIAKGDAAARLMLNGITNLICEVYMAEWWPESWYRKKEIQETETEGHSPLAVVKDYLNGKIRKDEAIKVLDCQKRMYKDALITLKENGYNPIPKRPLHNEGRYVGVRAPTSR